MAQRDLVIAHANIGLNRRSLEQFTESIEAFDRAITLANSVRERGLLKGSIEQLIGSLTEQRQRVVILAVSLGDWDQLQQQPPKFSPR